MTEFALRTTQDITRMRPSSVYLRECLALRDGRLFWMPRPEAHFSSVRIWRSWCSKNSGNAAGTMDSKGYIQIKVDGTLILAHRIIWVMAGGSWENSIDHIDGNPLNNAIENLREVSHQTNMKNRKRSPFNRSGLSGIHWMDKKQYWVAKINNLHIGTFHCLLDACAARKSAEIQHGFHVNHGRAA